MIKESLTPLDEMRGKLLRAFDYLRGRCDGAATLDGAGFNKRDASDLFVRNMENMLRDNKPMSERQLSATLNVLARYRTQLNGGGIQLPMLPEIQAALQQVAATSSASSASSQAPEKKVDITTIRVVNDLSLLAKDLYYGDGRKNNPRHGQAGTWIRIHVSYKDRAKWQEYKTTYFNRSKNEKGFEYYGCMWGSSVLEKNPAMEWEVPYTPEAFELLISKEYFPQAQLDNTATTIKFDLAEARANAAIEKTKEDARLQKEYEDICAQIDWNADFAPGKRFYQHQPVAIRFAIHSLVYRKAGVIIGDEMGLGKTNEGLIAAKLISQYHGNVPVHVVTTASMPAQWIEAARDCGLDITVWSWSIQKMPTVEELGARYIILFDEAHKAANPSAQCSKRMVELCHAEQCLMPMLLTGTPMSNGYAINIYVFLLACKHSLVYAKDAREVYRKKQDFVRQFCLTKSMTVRGRTIITHIGTVNETLFNRLVMYDPRRENHSEACCIQRLKVDCTDLPEKQRVKEPVEIPAAVLHIYAKTIKKMFEDYERRKEEKLAAFQVTYAEEHDGEDPSRDVLEDERNRINSAETIVAYGIYRHASAKAKVPYALDMAKQILSASPDEHVVFSTNFKDVAQEISHAIEDHLLKETGIKTFVPVIDGDVAKGLRALYTDMFQTTIHEGIEKARQRNKTNPMLKVADKILKEIEGYEACRAMVITGAGGEGITLTKAQTMIMLDRPWNPGRTQQFEDRLHRYSQAGTVTIYWLTMPSNVTDVDDRVDGIILKKAENTSAMLQGERKSLEFTDDVAVALSANAPSILKSMYKTAEKLLKTAKNNDDDDDNDDSFEDDVNDVDEE